MRRGAPIHIKRRSGGKYRKILSAGGDGDISNAQFAVLGLSACTDGNIRIPDKTWKRALTYITRNQNKDGGWGYDYDGRDDRNSYGSMTCAGVCGIAACRQGHG